MTVAVKRENVKPGYPLPALLGRMSFLFRREAGRYLASRKEERQELIKLIADYGEAEVMTAWVEYLTREEGFDGLAWPLGLFIENFFVYSPTRQAEYEAQEAEREREEAKKHEWDGNGHCPACAKGKAEFAIFNPNLLRCSECRAEFQRVPPITAKWTGEGSCPKCGKGKAEPVSEIGDWFTCSNCGEIFRRGSPAPQQ